MMPQTRLIETYTNFLFKFILITAALSEITCT